MYRSAARPKSKYVMSGLRLHVNPKKFMPGLLGDEEGHRFGGGEGTKRGTGQHVHRERKALRESKVHSFRDMATRWQQPPKGGV